jgi:HK97 family phage major capsid protein
MVKNRVYRAPSLTAPLPILGYRKNGAPIYPIAGADGTVAGNPVLDRLRSERDSQTELMDGILSQVETEKRDLVDAEKRNLEAIRDRIKELDEQIKPLDEFEALRSTSQRSAEPYRGTTPPEGGNMAARTNAREYEYRSAGEFLADGYRAQIRNDEGARSRLQSTGVILEAGMLVRAAAPHTTTVETPGLLPVPIVGEIMKNIDAARPFISSIGPKDLGSIPGTSFKRPVVTESVQVGKQSGEKTEVTDGQFKVGSIDFTKDTFGGWTNVSRQDIDWTSPGVWDALLTDFMEIYGLQTENEAADDFATAVVQATGTDATDPLNPTMDEWILGLYEAASLAYAGSGRLPDTIWTSLDQWVKLGSKIDQLKSKVDGTGGGDSALGSFSGNLLNIPRIVVPAFPAGTVIAGVKSRTEVYEDRIGFLTAVQPRVLGVEMAYGGYMANGTLKPEAFAKVTFD